MQLYWREWVENQFTAKRTACNKASYYKKPFSDSFIKGSSIDWNLVEQPHIKIPHSIFHLTTIQLFYEICIFRRVKWEAGEGGGAKELEVGERGVGKKCLNVRQKLGTRKKLKTLKFWKLLKRENFHNFENIIKWSLGHAEQLLFSCLYAFQKTLIIGENDNDFFLPQPHPHLCV